MLGAITLDLFAVLFGGAVALLPLFARADPPHRARSGSASCAARPPSARSLAGVMLDPAARRRAHRARRCSSSSRAFGVATIVFGLSQLASRSRSPRSRSRASST